MKLDPIKLFHTAAETIPAYKNFLKRNHFISSKINTMNDFKKIPITSKKNYISKYSPEKFFTSGTLPPFVYASSGSSGSPTLWFRGDKQEEIGSDMHEPLIKDFFKIKKTDTTLAIVSFYMGIWIAGGYSTSVFRGLSRKGYRVTTATPGPDIEDNLMILKKIAPLFSHVILMGYPTSVMNIYREAKRSGVKLPKKLHIITAGDAAPKTLNNTFSSHANIYGSADLGMIAYNGIFDPRHFFVEVYQDELLITTSSTATPLIRYNTKDFGVLLNENTLSIKGRSDVAIVFYSSYIYPSHLSKILNTNNYVAWRHISKAGHDTLHIALTQSKYDAKKISKKLAKINIEYAKVLTSYGKKALPKIHIISDIPSFKLPKGSEGILSISGKKPKMIIY